MNGEEIARQLETGEILNEAGNFFALRMLCCTRNSEKAHRYISAQGFAYFNDYSARVELLHISAGPLIVFWRGV